MKRLIAGKAMRMAHSKFFSVIMSANIFNYNGKRRNYFRFRVFLLSYVNPKN